MLGPLAGMPTIRPLTHGCAPNASPHRGEPANERQALGACTAASTGPYFDDVGNPSASNAARDSLVQRSMTRDVPIAEDAAPAMSHTPGHVPGFGSSVLGETP
jgi:hypothetical protein